MDGREVHCMTRDHRTHKTWPRLIVEQDDCIRLIFSDGFDPKYISISTDDARYLARKLNRLALRIERRLEQGDW